MFGSGEALKTNRGLFRRYSRWNEKRRGGSRGNLHGGRPVRWVLPYKKTLPNWFGKFGLGWTAPTREFFMNVDTDDTTIVIHTC